MQIIAMRWQQRKVCTRLKLKFLALSKALIQQDSRKWWTESRCWHCRKRVQQKL